MRCFLLVIFSLFIFIAASVCQDNNHARPGLLFRGLVIDASTLEPIPNSQIYINSSMSAVSTDNGSFTFYVYRSDTVIFNSLGYKTTKYFVSDTLKGIEFNAGIFMRSDTVEIGEVIIIPRRLTLRSEIMNAPARSPGIMDNARNNVAVSAYQGRISQSQLGDPSDNYAVISQRQKINAYEKGGIPSDQIVGLNPLLLIPAAYMLIKGFPEKPGPMNSSLTPEEVDQIHRKYLETIRSEK